MLEEPKDSLDPDNHNPPPPSSLPPSTPGGTDPASSTRRKGRKLHENRIEDLKKIIAFIESKGEATPGEIGAQLGMARSTLTYYMNQFLDYPKRSQSDHYRGWDNTGRTLGYCLEGKQIERLGAGRSVRYRVIPAPQQKQEGSP